MERGALRSGQRYAARNNPYYNSVQELLSHHERLLLQEPAVTTRVTRIAGLSVGSLSQTTVRFRFDSPFIRTTLRRVFFELFREHTLGSDTGFEVVTTFNAILTDDTKKTFSLFYGHDHRAQNVAGAAPELQFGGTTIVRVLADVDSIPITFDQQTLVDNHRVAFQESSNVKIHSFVNIVYLIYRYVDVRTSTAKRADTLDHQRTGLGASRS
jgi:hypothetical protein